jgi:ABC-2 type transport system permease protein
MLASPLTEVEIVLGYAVAFVGFSMVQTIIIIGTILLYSPAILLEIGIVFLLVFILVFGSVALAIAFSSRMKSELQVIQMIPLYIIPQLFFSGAFFSISFLPQILQFIPYLFPLTYYVQAVKAAMFFKASIVDILPHIIVLIFYASIGLLLAVTRGRR